MVRGRRGGRQQGDQAKDSSPPPFRPGKGVTRLPEVSAPHSALATISMDAQWARLEPADNIT